MSKMLRWTVAIFRWAAALLFVFCGLSLRLGAEIAAWGIHELPNWWLVAAGSSIAIGLFVASYGCVRGLPGSGFVRVAVHIILLVLALPIIFVLMWLAIIVWKGPSAHDDPHLLVFHFGVSLLTLLVWFWFDKWSRQNAA